MKTKKTKMDGELAEVSRKHNEKRGLENLTLKDILKVREAN